MYIDGFDAGSTSLIYRPPDIRLTNVYLGEYDINGVHCAVF